MNAAVATDYLIDRLRDLASVLRSSKGDHAMLTIAADRLSALYYADLNSGTHMPAKASQKPTGRTHDLRDITKARDLAISARDDIEQGRPTRALLELDKLLVILGPMLDARHSARQRAFKAKPKPKRATKAKAAAKAERPWMKSRMTGR